MRSLVCGLLVSLLTFTSLSALQTQDVTTGMKLTWSQGLVTETTLTLAQVNSFQYKARYDGNPGVVIPVTCTGNKAPFTCSTPVSASTALGLHSVIITAAAPNNSGGYTAEAISTVCNFRFIGAPISIPSAPYNLLFN